MPNTNGHGPKRAILYARVSTEEQARSGYSLAQQIEDMHGLRTSPVPGSRKFGAGVRRGRGKGRSLLTLRPFRTSSVGRF
jgi:DNA invertase Pin-like site-specific DNA recombinase